MPRKTQPKPPAYLACNTLELQYCHFRLQGKTEEEAAAAMGLDPVQGHGYAKRPCVKAYLEKYTDRFMDRMVLAETRKMLSSGITRDSIAQQLFYLGCMPPEMTRNSIDGQVEALKELADLMNYKLDSKAIPPALAGMSEAELEAFAQGKKTTTTVQ